MVMANEYILRLRRVDPEELRSEEEVLKKEPDTPFLGPGDRPEPYRRYFVAYARLEPVFQKEKIYAPLLADTPRGRVLVWRWWPSMMGVVLMKPRGSDWVLEETVTFLDPNESAQARIVLDQIVLNPPKWS